MHCRQQQNLAALVVSAERTCRQALLLDQARDALITIGLGGCITGWNPGAERLFGYAATESLGRDIRLLHVDPNDE
ncbi:MAG TPA: PAS domain S-box protein [Accumulibacter sp.]|uniref:PAS domain S-box protein n=1 Tax=Accumulibacter sp. TaxID=2053492 RepID=UPI002BD4419C|nr:PAS domain S-box protein [Accumulibacter sp.]HRF71340.1 PAS domain S-box protein [Accumulibacter sp.]